MTNELDNIVTMTLSEMRGISQLGDICILAIYDIKLAQPVIVSSRQNGNIRRDHARLVVTEENGTIRYYLRKNDARQNYVQRTALGAQNTIGNNQPVYLCERVN